MQRWREQNTRQVVRFATTHSISQHRWTIGLCQRESRDIRRAVGGATLHSLLDVPLAHAAISGERESRPLY